MLKEEHKVNKLNLPFIIILSYLLLRPIATMEWPFLIWGYRTFEIFAVFSTAILALALIGKVRFDRITLFMIFYMLYCLFNIVNGAQIRETIRQLFPFVCFVAIRGIISTEKETKIAVYFMLIGFIVIIWPNAYYIYKGVTLAKVLYITGIERHRGIFQNIHTMAHTMLSFSFLFAYYIYLKKFKPYRFFNLFLVLSMLLSIYGIYKSVTRTVIIGFLLFWSLFLFKYSKKLLIIFLVVSLSAFILYEAKVELIFHDLVKAVETDRERDIEAAGSGRIHLWEIGFRYFQNLSFERKLIGIGLGNEGRMGTAREGTIPDSHNDFLTLLITNGIIGLLLYLALYLLIFLDMVRYRFDDKLFYWQLAILFSVIAMNLFSNSYVSRFELGQLFWTYVGFFYISYKLKLRSNTFSD